MLQTAEMLSQFHVEGCDPGEEEVVMTGRKGAETVVARIATLDLERYFGRSRIAADEARRIVDVNLPLLERAVVRKCSHGEFHQDSLAGRPVCCVHLEVRDVVGHGDFILDSPTGQPPRST